MKKQSKPSDSTHLDPEEQALLASYEAGEFQSVATPALMEELRAAARTMGIKD